MKTLTVSGKKYKLPEWFVERNEKAEDFYQMLNVVEVLTGKEDFDRLDNDFLESECFSAYAEAKGVSEDDAMIHEVSEYLFAWVTDYDQEDYTLVYLEPI